MQILKIKNQLCLRFKFKFNKIILAMKAATRADLLKVKRAQDKAEAKRLEAERLEQQAAKSQLPESNILPN